jgi:hypothetical protein
MYIPFRNRQYKHPEKQKPLAGLEEKKANFFREPAFVRIAARERNLFAKVSRIYYNTLCFELFCYL